MKIRNILLACVLCAMPCFALAQSAGSFSDNFESRRLDSGHFTVLGGDDSVVNMGTRGLTLVSKGTTPSEAGGVSFSPYSGSWEVEVSVLLSPKGKAGLVLMQDRANWWGLTADCGSICVCSAEGEVSRISNPYGRYLHLRLQYDGGSLKVSAAPQKTRWAAVANSNPGVRRQPADGWRSLGAFDCGAGVRNVCLMAMDGGTVSYRDFWYREK